LYNKHLKYKEENIKRQYLIEENKDNQLTLSESPVGLRRLDKNISSLPTMDNPFIHKKP
jgi:hypothetical protein